MKRINSGDYPFGKGQEQAYDSFKHLCRSTFAQKSDLYVMLTVYLDGSGTSPANDVLAVGGYIGTVKQWERFNEKWKSMLSDYGIKMMHRSALESLKGEYDGWTKEKKERFLRRSHSIIRQSTYTAVGSVVVKRDFDEVIPKKMAGMLGGIYGFCAHYCLKAVKSWCEDHKYDGRIVYVFEAGSYGQGQLDEMLRLTYKNETDRLQYRLLGWSVHDKNTLPLQAADVVAYELFKIGEHHVATMSGRPLRISARDLFRKQDVRHTYYWTKKDLEIWLKEIIADHNQLSGSRGQTSTTQQSAKKVKI